MRRRGHAWNSGNIRYVSVGTGRTAAVDQMKWMVTLAITVCVLLALETTTLGRIRLPFFGFGAASPSLGLLFCMAVGFLLGEEAGGITGLFAGWLADSTGSGGMMLLPLMYFLCGYAAGAIGRQKLARNLPSFMVFSLCGGGGECVLLYVKAAIDTHTWPPPLWVWRGLVPLWILTILFSPVVYGLMKGEMKLLHAGSGRREMRGGLDV